MDLVSIELQIPKRYLKKTVRPDKFIAIAHKSWIKALYKHANLIEFKEYEHLDEWPQKNDELGRAWTKIYICVYRKRNAKVIPLPRPHSISNLNETDLTFFQLLHYVMQTNHRNLWKEAYKKYTNVNSSRDAHINLTDYNSILREIIVRTWGCSIVNICDPNQSLPSSKHYECHTNLLPAICCVESSNCFYTMHVPYVEHTLQDCLTYSPAIFETTYIKPLFIIFQILQALRAMHDRGLTIGDISLADIHVDANLWVQILPQLDSNLIVRHEGGVDVTTTQTSTSTTSRITRMNKIRSECSQNVHNYENGRCLHCGVRCYDKVVVTNEANLEQLCTLWVHGQISNFTYLTALNNLAGRRYGEPNCHHVFPWVTDFTSRCGNNWRDLTKSKYRLNKGDRQLDITYEGNLVGNQVPHHISDVLSSITYYVYMARRTPKSVLCKNVRTVWVPAEYPSSIQRLQEWTPDECIPEFFAKPSVFKSIHEDLADLEVPPWSSSPEDFIDKHREALESAYVSERLHHWIDLTFGYKLSGTAAVKAKNIILQLVDNHQFLSKSGVVQLFFFPHPPRQISISPWAGRLPPKIHFIANKQRKRDSNVSLGGSGATEQRVVDEDDLSTTEDDQNSPQQTSKSLILSRFLSRSRNSLNEDTKIDSTPASTSTKISPKATSKIPTFLSHIQPSTNQMLLDSDKKMTFQSYIAVGNSQKSAGSGGSNLTLPTQKSISTQGSIGTIYLPKDYNPTLNLVGVEQFYNFLTKTFYSNHSNKHCGDVDDNLLEKKKSKDFDGILFASDASLFDSGNAFDETQLNNAFTNRIFTENYEAKLRKSSFFADECEPRKEIKQTHKQAVAMRRLRELQILGCLIVEIFMSKHLRALGLTVQLNFNSRLNACLTVIKSCKDSMSCCIKYIVELLLQTRLSDANYLKNFRYPTVTDKGLPPPSAHQLLQPLLTNNIIQFPRTFWLIYKFSQTLQNFTYLIHEHDILTFFNCSGDMCLKYEQLEKTRMALIRNINECKVKVCANELENILQKIDTNISENIDLILPRVIELIEDHATGVLAAWYLFDPIAKTLGPRKTKEKLLQPILKMYEDDIDMYLIHNQKMEKLYHHSFLLRLIVRFGLKHFLDHFITPLVEAVGGYRDFEDNDIPLHSHIIDRPTLARRTSKLQDVDDNEPNDILSPTDDDSTADSTKDMSTKNVSLINENSDEKQKLVEAGADMEPEVFVFDKEDKLASPNDEKLYTKIIDHILDTDDIETGVAVSEDELIADDKAPRACAMSPTIPIPSSHSRAELLTINCEIGSKISQNSGVSDDLVEKDVPDGTSAGGPGSPKSADDQTNHRNAYKHHVKISEVSSDSVLWLSHRLGPVLTAKYLSRNLLRMLTLCYLGKENQMLCPVTDKDTTETVSILDERVAGDSNASRVIECLVAIAALYGEQLVILQYLPHITELIVLCKRRLTSNLEGGLISCIVLLKHLIPYISNETLITNLQDNILKLIIIPSIRLVGTTRTTFPNGATARSALVRKLTDTLYLIMRRARIAGVQHDIFIPALQRLFLIFDKVFGGHPQQTDYFTMKSMNVSNTSETHSMHESSGEHFSDDSNYLEVRRDGSVAEWAFKDGMPKRVGSDAASSESWSPPLAPTSVDTSNENNTSTQDKAILELKEVFTSELAYKMYVPIVNFLGDTNTDSSIRNNNLIQELCFEYKQEIDLMFSNSTNMVNNNKQIDTIKNNSCCEQIVGSTGSFGTNVSMIGNRIDVLDNYDIYLNSHFLNHKMENTNRHLRGNWLAYWEHEIGRADKDAKFNFKQIKLQTFQGHVGSVRALCILDNENSFLSGSRDKTIKLWSLRSQGDGQGISQPQWTYTKHKKSVLAVTFLSSLGLAVSCDSTVHIWDPFLGVTITVLESSVRNNAPVNLLKAMPSPNSTLLAATTDGTIKIIDTRVRSYAQEYKVTTGPGSLIRCLAMSLNGNLLGIGHCTGNLSLLDLRCGGVLLASWKGHEGEVLQLAVPDSFSLISSSLDQTVSVWNINDGKFKFFLKGPTEPVHCLCCYNNELISGTTANRIGVYNSIEEKAIFSSNRLRSETFKGVLTSMSILPLNKLLLLGSDGGNISLLC